MLLKIYKKGGLYKSMLSVLEILNINRIDKIIMGGRIYNTFNFNVNLNEV